MSDPGFDLQQPPFRVRAAEHWPTWSAISGVIAITAAMFAYALLDRPAARSAHTDIPPNIERFFDMVTHLGSSEPWLIWGGVLLGLCVVLRLWTRAAAVGLIVASVAASGLLVNLFKWIAGRVRPEGLLIYDMHGFELFHTNYHLTSFPSGHSATIAAAMTALALLWPRPMVIWIIAAVLVGASRVVLTAHYPSDVIIGMWVGFTVTLMLNAAWLRWIEVHFPPKPA